MHNKGYCKKLKHAREKLGITQYELADKLRVSASSIGMYEQGRREPDCYTLTRICDILKLSVFDVLYDSDVFYIDSILQTITKYLGDIQKAIILNGKILDEKARQNIAYVIKLILNSK